MEARQEYTRFPTHALLVVIGLVLALLLGGVAGYALHGLGTPRASISETVTKDQVPDWMRQGTGPTDADALQETQHSAQERAESATGDGLVYIPVP